MDGHYYHVAARLYAKTEFERLLYASYYKNVTVRPQRRRADSDIVEKLMAAGFANIHDDMDTEFWLVKADRSMPEMALLKSMYTKEQRKALAEYLHRIEYDVDAARQSRDFWAFYEEAGLFPDYVASFVKQAVFHPSWFFRRLRMESGEECEMALAILASMRENASDSAEIRWIDERIDTLRAAGGNG